MKLLDLFSGIGGFALAAEWCWGDELEIVSFCEIDKYCQQVLNKHWPEVSIHDNIKTLKVERGSADIICGGFPCQPFSTAGKRFGTEDDRYLWPEMLRVIRDIKPQWVVGENVHGLISWNEGLVFEQVLSDLEAEGYEVQSFLIPACGIDAPHRRDRIWIVAHTNHTRPHPEKEHTAKRRFKTQPGSDPGTPEASSNPPGLHGGECEANPPRRGVNMEEPRRCFADDAVPRLCRVDDGLPGEMDRLKGLGNAIVPQLALQIFETIKAYDDIL